jgi:hypothetical protein
MVSKNYVAAFGLAGFAAVLIGCGGGGGSSSTGGATNGNGGGTPGTASVRAVNALDGVATATWSLPSQTGVSFPSVAYGSVSGTGATHYTTITASGSQAVDFDNSSAPSTVVATSSIDPLSQSKMTFIGYGTPGPNGQVVALYDQTSNATDGPEVRVVDAALDSGDLDVTISPTGFSEGTTPSPISPGAIYPTQATGTYTYQALPLPGSYTVDAYPRGHDTGTPVFTYVLNVSNTDVWTLILIDPATAGGTPSVLAVQNN